MTVTINGHLGNLLRWGNDGEVDYKGEIVTGGLLQWTQKGTYIEIYSSTTPMEKMLDIVRSMECHYRTNKAKSLYHGGVTPFLWNFLLNKRGRLLEE